MKNSKGLEESLETIIRKERKGRRAVKEGKKGRREGEAQRGGARNARLAGERVNDDKGE